jgi:hypothetical protein
MKKLFITLIAAIALTHAAHAGGWMWFHGDIGVSSPFTLSSSPTNNNTTAGAVSKRKVVTKQKGAFNRSVARSKSKSTQHRITAR